LHEGCDEGGEAEAFDDYGAEVGDACEIEEGLEEFASEN
jgi:hypothetical protein